MNTPDLSSKPGAELREEDVAKLACALKSLAVYDALAHEHADDPEELREIVAGGLEVVNRLFN